MFISAGLLELWQLNYFLWLNTYAIPFYNYYIYRFAIKCVII